MLVEDGAGFRGQRARQISIDPDDTELLVAVGLDACGGKLRDDLVFERMRIPVGHMDGAVDDIERSSGCVRGGAHVPG